jgi:NADH-quinone oxidoreductase subunit K
MFFYHLDLFKHLFLSLALFLVGTLGVFITRRNIIVVLMSIELMLLGVNLFFIFLSIFLDDGLGQIVIYYRLRGVISIDYISTIKG